MEARKLISKFLTSLCEKNYSEAHKDLEKVVAHKATKKIAKTAEKVKGKPATKTKKGKAGKNSKNVTKKG
jgi:hypothetical protein